KEARPQHAQDRAGNRDSEVSAVPGDEASASRVCRVRVLCRRAASRGQGSLTLARIALDAMGGDFAPQATVAGALLALAELDPAHSIQLVGRSAVIEEQLQSLMAGERGKPNSSMAVGLRLQAEGKSDAFVSAGNTGAQMAASMVLLRLHAGLNRPAIATFFPTLRHPIVVLDSGANVDCSPEELVQFARLGATYAQC